MNNSVPTYDSLPAGGFRLPSLSFIHVAFEFISRVCGTEEHR
jgi:hypothetical protein